ncbi:hypothetical protein DM02DRAFT_242119 [Periconia macrospinosa]|uniref:Uncharacterized protein n=1 Tax=Periconia macrospinosa TaxID=97972 RepID=A0A2V1D6P3_9PLEO|nr:hypothetical protein DM02DRAFT_242119 [Periconia macrospinosa]
MFYAELTLLCSQHTFRASTSISGRPNIVWRIASEKGGQGLKIGRAMRGIAVACAIRPHSPVSFHQGCFRRIYPSSIRPHVCHLHKDAYVPTPSMGCLFA